MLLLQVWAGTEACEPVTWQECKLVPKDVQFIVPDITCSDKQELWYHEPEEKTDTRMTNTFTCEPRSSSHCESQVRPDCKTITWSECRLVKLLESSSVKNFINREVPVTNCLPKEVHLPTQELLHRKKCLLPDSGKSASNDFMQEISTEIIIHNFRCWLWSSPGRATFNLWGS